MEERNERVLSYGETYLGIVYRQNDGRYAIEGQDGRLFFPHRSWSDLRPGICKITYIRDKGTYGFVTGQFTRSDVPKESRVVTRLLETAQSIAPEELFVKQQITSDLYGRVVVITHGFSEVLHVVYNSVDDPERKECVLSLGRRMDFNTFPFAPDGSMYHFGKFTSYFRKFKPFVVEDCVAERSRNGNGMVVFTKSVQIPFRVDLYLGGHLQEGPCRITAISSQNHVIASNYNYRQPTETFLRNHLLQVPFGEHNQKIRLACGFGFVEKGTNGYGVVIDVLNSSGEFCIRSVYGMTDLERVGTAVRMLDAYAVQTAHIRRSEIQDIRYLSIDDDHLGEWRLSDTPYKPLVIFDRVRTIGYRIDSPKPELVTSDELEVNISPVLQKAIDLDILSFQRVERISYIDIKWYNIERLNQFTGAEIINLSKDINAINEEANDRAMRLAQRGKLKLSL